MEEEIKPRARHSLASNEVKPRETMSEPNETPERAHQSKEFRPRDQYHPSSRRAHSDEQQQRSGLLVRNEGHQTSTNSGVAFIGTPMAPFRPHLDLRPYSPQQGHIGLAYEDAGSNFADGRGQFYRGFSPHELNQAISVSPTVQEAAEGLIAVNGAASRFPPCPPPASRISSRNYMASTDQPSGHAHEQPMYFRSGRQYMREPSRLEAFVERPIQGLQSQESYAQVPVTQFSGASSPGGRNNLLNVRVQHVDPHLEGRIAMLERRQSSSVYFSAAFALLKEKVDVNEGTFLGILRSHPLHDQMCEFPSSDDDVEFLLEDRVGLSEEQFAVFKESLLTNLRRVRETMCYFWQVLQTMLRDQSKVLPMSSAEITYAYLRIAGIYRNSRNKVIYKYQGFLKVLKSLELSINRERRGCLDLRQNAVLRIWLFDHFENPYPTDAEKTQLSQQLGISVNQINNWFINGRVRIWKEMVELITGRKLGQSRVTDDHSFDEDEDDMGAQLVGSGNLPRLAEYFSGRTRLPQLTGSTLSQDTTPPQRETRQPRGVNTLTNLVDAAGSHLSTPVSQFRHSAAPESNYGSAEGFLPRISRMSPAVSRTGNATEASGLPRADATVVPISRSECPSHTNYHYQMQEYKRRMPQPRQTSSSMDGYPFVNGADPPADSSAPLFVRRSPHQASAHPPFSGMHGGDSHEMWSHRMYKQSFREQSPILERHPAMLPGSSADFVDAAPRSLEYRFHGDLPARNPHPHQVSGVYDRFIDASPVIQHSADAPHFESATHGRQIDPSTEQYAYSETAGLRLVRHPSSRQDSSGKVTGLKRHRENM